MKVHAVPQVEEVDQSAVRDVPGGGQPGHDRTVAGKLHQPFKHIAVQNL